MSGIWRLSAPCSEGWLKRCTSHRTWVAERDALLQWAPHMQPPGPPLRGAYWDGAQGWLWTGHVEGRSALEVVVGRCAPEVVMGRCVPEVVVGRSVPEVVVGRSAPEVMDERSRAVTGRVDLSHGRTTLSADAAYAARLSGSWPNLCAQWRILLHAVGAAAASLHRQELLGSDALPLDTALSRRAARTLRELGAHEAVQAGFAACDALARTLVLRLQDIAPGAPDAQTTDDAADSGESPMGASAQRADIPMDDGAHRAPIPVGDGQLQREAVAGLRVCLQRVAVAPVPTGAARVPCHRDLQPRNWLVDDALELQAVIDFEHSGADDPLVDLLRLHEELPLLDEEETLASFLEGYGRGLTRRERERLGWLRALHVLQTACWALRRGDGEFARRALRAAIRRAR